MSHTYKLTRELYYTRIRVPKDEAFFVYFTFESNEGLCYFSTADESIGGQYRDIDVKCPVEAKSSLKALIERLQTELRLDVISEEIMLDG
ncbi:MAG TPA: hypothetical protein VNJ08_08010 [Bacteriovoracaceae bacterium]|nr:hypothetical protein [Bacteriovoracaceae bacterium]